MQRKCDLFIKLSKEAWLASTVLFHLFSYFGKSKNIDNHNILYGCWLSDSSLSSVKDSNARWRKVEYDEICFSYFFSSIFSSFCFISSLSSWQSILCTLGAGVCACEQCAYGMAARFNYQFRKYILYSKNEIDSHANGELAEQTVEIELAYEWW